MITVMSRLSARLVLTSESFPPLTFASNLTAKEKGKE